MIVHFLVTSLIKLLSMKNLPILLNTFCLERFLLLRRKWYEMRVTLLWFQLLRVYISDQYYRVQKAVWLFKGALFQLKKIYFLLEKWDLYWLRLKLLYSTFSLSIFSSYEPFFRHRLQQRAWSITWYYKITKLSISISWLYRLFMAYRTRKGYGNWNPIYRFWFIYHNSNQHKLR